MVALTAFLADFYDFSCLVSTCSGRPCLPEIGLWTLRLLPSKS